MERVSVPEVKDITKMPTIGVQSNKLSIPMIPAYTLKLDLKAIEGRERVPRQNQVSGGPITLIMKRAFLRIY